MTYSRFTIHSNLTDTLAPLVRAPVKGQGHKASIAYIRKCTKTANVQPHELALVSMLILLNDNL